MPGTTPTRIFIEDASVVAKPTNVDATSNATTDPNIPSSSSLSPLLNEEEGRCSNSVGLGNLKSYLSEATVQSVKESLHKKRLDLFHDCVVEIEAFQVDVMYDTFKYILFLGKIISHL